MLNPEFAETVNGQIEQIFGDAFPSEVRFRECNELIKRTRTALKKIPESGFDEPDYDPKARTDFTTTLDDAKSAYEISYFRIISINSTEERFTIVKNRAEEIRLVSYGYIDGRCNAFVEYFNDSPEFTKLKSNDFEENRKEADRIVSELENFPSKA